MTWHPDQPYNLLPLLPPTCELETRAILKRCITARAALAELKQAAGLIPNQDMLINTMPLLEAKDSSAIENIVTSTDKLFQFVHSDSQADPATKEALRYRTALYRGFQSLAQRPLCTATAVDICRTTKGVDMDIRRTPGTRLANNRSGEVIYTPPEGEANLRELLANWERFLHNEVELDPLVRMAVGHYQFEAIHPFSDGNGRTGRILLILFLLQQRLLEQPILFLSRYIIENKNHYYRHLREVTETGAWEPWILYVLRAVETTAETTVLKIEAIGDLLTRLIEEGRLKLPKRTFSKELIEQLFVRPYCKIRHLEEAGLGNRVSASRYLHDLATAGLVAKLKAGKEILFVNERLVKLLAN